ncbi:MAG TPA: DUF2877 domain-containing protein [Ktedonobacteraceae bacterium]|nr:DUF2877 domain-containing protein [Ktedonobacteraceae bacterium]
MPVGTALARPARPRMVSYSISIATAVAGPLQRGLVHSVFQAAANIVFPGDFLLSLNTATSPRMPNGIQLPTFPGTMPLSHLHAGIPVLLGVQRLCIQPLDYILDLSSAVQWNPFIERPATLDLDVVKKNIAWLAQYENTIAHCGRPSPKVVEMARSLCGRGRGLTPTGDDMLAGWMAIGWLLYGPQPDFLAACQQIVAIARQQTHLLSQCWLEYAANGYVAEPIGRLLHALTQKDEQQLVQSTQAVLAMGATSGHDLIQGILMAAS